MLTTQNQTYSLLLPSLFNRTMAAIEEIVPTYSTVSLHEIEEYALQDRVDVKFLVRIVDVPSLLSILPGSYSILEVENKRISAYRTLYFDTPCLTFYFDHHNGKRPRYKIRMREYHSTNDTFLEVKKRENELRTVKNRMPIAHIRPSFSAEMRAFLAQHYPEDRRNLKAVLRNNFKRITLVNLNACERATIDMGLSFSNRTNSLQLSHLAVVEVKQDNYSRESVILQALREKGYQPMSFSKYCTGIAFLNPDIKRNRFKQNFLQFKASTKRIYKNGNISPVYTSLSF